MKNELILATGLLGLTASCVTESAKTTVTPKGTITVVKCLGVAKAGHNDCGSTDGRHKCGGLATKDLDPTEWKYLPDGPLCEAMGGTKMVKKGEVVKKQKPSAKFFDS
jgi:uncharacterized membrane protein